MGHKAGVALPKTHERRTCSRSADVHALGAFDEILALGADFAGLITGR